MIPVAIGWVLVCRVAWTLARRCESVVDETQRCYGMQTPCSNCGARMGLAPRGRTSATESPRATTARNDVAYHWRVPMPTVDYKWHWRRSPRLGGERLGTLLQCPALSWVVQTMRPDLHIHVDVENAGSTMEVHRRCMRRSLGIDVLARQDPTIDAARWAVFPRKRLFLSTLS